MLLAFSIIKALSEVIALALLGQGALWVLAGAGREHNFIYRMFAIITKPVMQLARILMPRVVLDRHLWLVAIGLVVALWIFGWTMLLDRCLGVDRSQALCADIVQRKVDLCLQRGTKDALCEELVQAVKQKAGQPSPQQTPAAPPPTPAQK